MAASCCWSTRHAARGGAPPSARAKKNSVNARSLTRTAPSPPRASINPVHSDAPTAAATDWGQILKLYDQLLALAPSPIVALNRAVAVAEVEGARAALRV